MAGDRLLARVTAMAAVLTQAPAIAVIHSLELTARNLPFNAEIEKG
jgi:hypothetical protein